MSNALDTFERFMLRVKVKEVGCWLWTGMLDSKGYGVVVCKPSWVLAHRYAYTTAFGQITPGLSVCHRCDNPRCVRPSHLFAGTHLDNQRDMTAKGRGRTGERNGRSKLSDKEVAEIRRLYTGKRGDVSNLALRYGMSRGHIYKILKGTHR